MVQQVRWDKIPAYCREFKNVGHSSSVCYAVGKTERPTKRDYNNATPQGANQEVNGPAEKQANTSATPNDNNEWKWQKKNKGKGASPRTRPDGEKRFDPVWEGPDIVGGTLDVDAMEREPQNLSNDRFEGAANKLTSGPSQAPTHGRGNRDGTWGHDGSHRRMPSSSRGGSRGGFRPFLYKSGWSGDDSSRNVMSTNKYYSLMANGEYDVDGCGEEEVAEMDIQPIHDQADDTPLQSDAGEYTREEDRQIVLFQGGPSYLPGTNLPC